MAAIQSIALVCLTPATDGNEVNAAGFLKTSFPESFHSWFYGRNLNLASYDLPHYFDEAHQFNRQLDQFLIDGESLKARLTRLFSRLDNGRSFSAAPGMSADQNYVFTTFRCHMPQGYIPAHSDNEFMVRPSYRHLIQLCQPAIMSFVLVFSCSEQGGETEIFRYRTPNVSNRIMSDDIHGEKTSSRTTGKVQFIDTCRQYVNL